MGRHLRSRALLATVLGTVSAYANPNLPQGTWVDITPPGLTKGDLNYTLGQGIQIDLRSPSTVYFCNGPYDSGNGGVFKTTDGGSTWRRVAKVTPAWNGASDHIDIALHVRIDPNDSNHLYAGDGVRGSSTGFFVSHDAGESFVKPQGFVDARTAAGIDNEDIYDVAVDPTDFNHVLVSFHYRWGWTDTKWNTNSGVMESKDGGDSWIIHEPINGWGSGHAVKFLHAPALGIGDSNTWLLATQGDGFWRTTDAGGTWTQVSKTNITHGGATIYYTKSKMLYASGVEAVMRSSDNGATWTNLSVGSAWCVYGDGTTLYTGRSFGANQPYSVSPETDGQTWKAYNSQSFPDGPYEMAYDAVNGIMYSSNWSSGVWALKVGPGDPNAGMGGSPGAGGSVRVDAGGAGGASGRAGAPAGAGGSAPGGTADAGTEPGEEPSTDAGCSCRVSGVNGGSSLALIGLLLAVSRRPFRRLRRRAGFDAVR